MNIQFFPILLAFFLASSLSRAEIMDLGNITLDSISGLEWLDLTETTNRSYDSVYAELQSGVGLGGDGWRYATIEEFEELLFNLGATAMSCAGGVSFCGAQPDSQPANQFQSLLGVTFSYTHPTDPERYGTQYTSNGILADLGSNIYSHWVSSVNTRTANPSFGWYTTHGQSYRSNYQTPSIGSFLVRDFVTVPLPATTWLFLSALAGLVGIRARKKYLTL